MKYVILIPLILIILTCKEATSTNFKLYYFKTGKTKEIKSEKLPQILSIVEKLILNTEDMLKLRVSDKKINTIKKNDSGIELVFKKRIRVTSKQFGIYEIKKILIPFEGEFTGSEKSPVVTIFLADKGYLSGPLRNFNGLNSLKEIKGLMQIN